MTDTQSLRQIIESKGLKYNSIAKEIGITPYSLQKKINSQNDFKGREIAIISNLLSLTDQQRNAIFFTTV